MKKINDRRIDHSDDDKLANGLSRRDLIKLVTVAGVGAACPVGKTLNLVLNNLVNKAIAADKNVRNLICFSFDGGIPRFYFDCPLTPNGSSDIFLPNPMVKTKLIPDSTAHQGFNYEYKTTVKHGIHMPHIWDLEVPRSGGGRRPLDELLNNMFIIRGVNMEIDSHPGGNMKIMAPQAGGISVSGLVADEGKGFIPAVSIGYVGAQNAVGVYKSPKGTGNIYINPQDPNYLTGMLAAFQADAKISSFRNNALVKSKIDTAIEIMQNWALKHKSATDPIFTDRKKAEEMFRSTIMSVGGNDFENLRLKYKAICDALIQDAKNGMIPGITDMEIPGVKFPYTVPGIDKKFISFGNFPSAATNSNYLTNQYNFEGFIVGNTDMKSMFKDAHFNNMVKHFALCEYVITKGLTNSFVTILPTLENIYYENSPKCVTLSTNVEGLTQANVDGNTVFNCTALYTGYSKLAHDSHATGALVALMQFTVMYMGYGACLLELIDRLKATPYNASNSADKRTMFDETVIETGSEFDRLPDYTGGGSQHGPWGNTFSFLSGCIPKLSLVGNIRKGDKYPGGGTWGAYHQVKGAGGIGLYDNLRATHVANSLCVLLKSKTVSTAEVPVLYLDSEGNAQVNKDIESPKNLPDQ